MKRIVAAAIINDDRILIARRNYGSLEGYWEFPGGKVEGNETDKQGLAREIREEFSIDIDVEQYLGEESLRVDGKEYTIVLYQARLLGTEIQLSVHSEIVWIKKEEFSKYKLAPVDERLVKNIWG